ncbi:NADPH-dependent ferric siderophore reductase, contains FAD-binding and SIP domains [Paracoccus isoporae]|uniref:NADPH-dependent ferric siderophore reductase, contains FAD-binding and SIP domains n=1 Tax=Paracoccus isoporae TaxID=591205 RepID=A0A1G7GHC4_9RHOB|nr:siderophore-interacting protein [Paracoccus isoporae]SDE87530.1 NADPH-dependent ferric siderophore reductase, contains FAD-binding and SIP domains [Paracoccus isoporae]
MRHDPLPPFQAEAPVGIGFAQLDAFLRSHAGEYGLEWHDGHGRSTWVKLGAGEFGARRSGEASIVYARAESPDWLHTLKEAVAYHVEENFGAAEIPLQWSGPEQAGQHPPNFSLARIRSVRCIGRNFLRLRLEGDRLERLDRDMIHFRLIPPHPDAPTQWPRLTATGQTQWPQELHRPAYTVAAIDAAAGWLDTDIFIHDGGRICAFAARAAVGTELGLTGPGGGGIPMAGRLLIGGDETAYPALGRIIAAQAPESRIDCHLFGAGADYPFPRHPGLTLSHTPSGEAALSARLQQDWPGAERVWIATEKARLQPLKQAVLAHLPKTMTHLAAYWSAPRSA